MESLPSILSQSINKDFTQVAWSPSVVCLSTQMAEWVQQLTHVEGLLSHSSRTFLHFQLARQVTTSCLPAPLPLHIYLFHWIWSCSSPSLWCPGHASSQLHPTQLCQVAIKGNFLHSPQKSRKWLSKGKFYHGVWFCPVTRRCRDTKSKLRPLTCSLLQQLGCGVGRCLGRVFCYFLQWICRKGWDEMWAPDTVVHMAKKIWWQNSQTVTELSLERQSCSPQRL